MKNRLIKGLFCSTIATIIACSPAKEQPTTAVIDKEQIKKEIQAKEDAFAEIYNTGVIKDIGYYADDAVTYFQNTPAIIGKPAIVEFLSAGLESNTNKISFKTNEVFVSSDGIQVVEVGYYTVVDSTNTPINTGNYMSLFEKRNGSYVCVRDMSASDQPLQ